MKEIKQRDKSILETNIDLLKSYISTFESEKVLNMIASEFYHSDNLIKSTGLYSPYKLYFYVIGLLFSTASVENSKYTEENHKIVKKYLNNITKYYAKLFFPKKGEKRDDLEEKWYKNREIAMPAFLHYFNVAELASDEQIIDRIEKYYLPFSDIIKEKHGFTIENALLLYQNINKTIQENYNRLIELYKITDKIRIDIVNKITARKFTPERVQSELKKGNTLQYFEELVFLMNNLYIVDKKDFTHIPNYNKLLTFFTTLREKGDFRYFTERNPAEKAPIFQIRSGKIFIGFPRQLLVSIHDKVYEEIKSNSKGHSFLKKRDIYLEQKTFSLLKEYSCKCTYLNLSETPEGQYEHDVIVQYNKKLLICECKASEAKEPFRDPDKAARRILRQFQSDKGIQKGYDQANSLKQKILKNEIEE